MNRSEAGAVLMLRGVAGVLEQHHQVQVLDEAIEAAVALSHRYIPARQLPDKAVSLLDTACARVAISQHATPAEVEDILRRRQALEVERGIIGREAAIGIEVADRQARVEAGLAETEVALAAAQARWDREKTLVADILDLRARLRGEGMPLDAATAQEPVSETQDPTPRKSRSRRTMSNPQLARRPRSRRRKRLSNRRPKRRKTSRG